MMYLRVVLIAVAVAIVSVAGLQTERVASAKSLTPIYWMHVPKCGSSLAYALSHIPKICDCDLPSSFDPHYVMRSPIEAIPDSCPGAFVWHKGGTFSDHSGIDNIYSASVKGHGVVMLRQPEQRIISAYNNGAHSWPKYLYKRWPKDVREYAEAVHGCTVKMMTRNDVSKWFGYDGPNSCGDPHPVTKDEASLAVKRLREGFVFVGLTEEWALSMCLFRKQFGGDCLESDFFSVPNPPTDDWTKEEISKNTTNSALYNTSQLGDFRDRADGDLYNEAQRLFAQATKSYSVTMASCAPCFKQAKYTPEPSGPFVLRKSL
jgi:hypothetical protein